VVERLCRLERLRSLEACLIAPGLDENWQKAFFVSGGALQAVRALPLGPGALIEIEAGLSLCRSGRRLAGETLTPEQAEDLVLLDGFVRRPPPEVTVLPLDRNTIAGRITRKGRAGSPALARGGRPSA
jgi:hypothetical protein